MRQPDDPGYYKEIRKAENAATLYDPLHDPHWQGYPPTYDRRKDQDRDFVNDDNDMLIVIVGFGACIVVSFAFGAVFGAVVF